MDELRAFLKLRPSNLSEKVDVTNDYQMCDLKLRQPLLVIDRKCFKKTDEEKKLLKDLKAKYKHNL